VARSSVTYRRRRPNQDSLRLRLKELAHTHLSYGYRRLHVLLRQEGWPINHKRVYRLYRDEGLALKRETPKRRRSAVPREDRVVVDRPNERWAMDFMHDTLSQGEKIRVLTVIDVFTREALAVEGRSSFRAGHVVEVLSKLVSEQDRPEVIQCDQGTGFTSMVMDHWAYWNQVRLDFSRPGRPGDNAVNEAFNGTVRRECLSQHYFLDLKEANRILDNWRREYNNDRPHSSLEQIPPTQFREEWVKTEIRSKFKTGGHFGLRLGADQIGLYGSKSGTNSYGRSMNNWPSRRSSTIRQAICHVQWKVSLRIPNIYIKIIERLFQKIQYITRIRISVHEA
jgi:putative transposase